MHIEGSNKSFFLQQKKNKLFLLNAANGIEYDVIFSPELLGAVKTDSGVISSLV